MIRWQFQNADTATRAPVLAGRTMPKSQNNFRLARSAAPRCRRTWYVRIADTTWAGKLWRHREQDRVFVPRTGGSDGWHGPAVGRVATRRAQALRSRGRGSRLRSGETLFRRSGRTARFHRFQPAGVVCHQLGGLGIVAGRLAGRGSVVRGRCRTEPGRIYRHGIRRE